MLLCVLGDALLTQPRFNKGTAFPIAERKTFKLTGRLPHRVATLDEQCDRAYGQLQSRDIPIRKNSFLQSLKDQNWTLYFALLSRHLKEVVPIIYTPTEAEAIENYSHLFRRSEGLFLTFTNADTMEEDFLEQTKGRDIELVVCTDSEAILGIGDQGVGFPCSLIGGIDPSKSLAVALDVGTNNKKLLDDPLYVGWKHERIRGEEYDAFIDKFVQLVRKHYPHCLLHFEDFGVSNAHRLLEIYRDTHAVFNDDIQGTGAVTLACIMAAIGVSRISSSSSSSPATPKRTLSDQRYVILGAGSAGLGIAVQLRDAMMAADGTSRSDANSKFWLVDKEGLLYIRDGEAKVKGVRGEFVRGPGEGWGEEAEITISLLDVIKQVKPTVLIGCSTSAGAFTEEVVRAMLEGLDDGERPIILPLSNPSRLVEAKPEDILRWTEGRALVATGSPFDSVKIKAEGKDKETEFIIAECNNALIYPGLGLGAIISQSRRMTDTMLIAGARRLAALSPAIRTASSDTDDSEYGDYDGAALLPDFADAPRVNFEVAVAVAEQAIKEGSATASWVEHIIEEGEPGKEGKEVKLKKGAVREKVKDRIWLPVYADFVFDPEGFK
ncbi:hypothetical protein BDQ12DRAFT_704924 [Crucibulum laeve]|uniref:Malic enzyme n=1 Tax=Crucibulum laeve TaxID=68775 RepID=A0A5C3M3F2_9AGAR|nr:hypothetical protein BDQ12DRAFT_704924 [Crucibulum laeve]